jgi:hypothetical protein
MYGPYSVLALQRHQLMLWLDWGEGAELAARIGFVHAPARRQAFGTHELNFLR